MQPLIAGCAVMALFFIASLIQGEHPPRLMRDEADE